MLIDVFEAFKLMFSIILFIIPAFLLAKLIIDKISFFERIVFEFGFGILYFIPTMFLLHIIFKIKIDSFPFYLFIAILLK